MRFGALIALVGLVVVGIALACGVLIMSKPLPAPAAARTAPAAAEPAAARLQHMLAQQSNEIRRLKKEKTALLDELGQHITELSKPEPPASPAGGAAAPRTTAMSKMISVAVRQQAEMKLAALKSRLHLTDEQAAAVEELLKKQTDHQMEMASKMFDGKLTAEDMKSASKLDFDGQLKPLLSADQWTGYQQFKTQEQQQQVQMASQGEMMQISPMLQLSDQQREQVSGILQQQYQQIIAKQSDAGSSGLGGLQMMDQMLDSKKEALRSVLTPDQMQSYEKFVESQREMIKSMIPQSQSTPAP